MRRRPVVRLYAALLLLLPPDLRGYRGEMVEAFERMQAEEKDRGARLRITVRAFGRLPAVMVLEWLEHLGARRAPGRTTTTGGRRMELFRDLRHALRSLAKAPAFALAAVGLVAIGVGSVTTIFSVVDHVLLRALPYPDEERLVYLQNGSHSGPFYQRLDEVETVEVWAAASSRDVRLTGSGEPRLLPLSRVTPGFWELLGARAARGRLLNASDGNDAVVVSGAAWRSRWGGDPGLVGRTLQIDGEPAVVVGVLDPDFEAPEALVDPGTEFWRAFDWTEESLRDTDFNLLQVAGRVRVGVGLESVQAGVDGLLAALAESDVNFRTREGELVRVPVVSLAEETVYEVRRGLGLLLGAVGLLLLVACANLAHLFLARGLGRTREMAVRRALGARTGDLTRHLLAESLAVGLAGGLVGTLLAAGGLRLFTALSPTALPRAASVSLDLRILGFALGMAVLTAVLFGLVPALRGVGAEVSDHLHAGGRTATGTRHSRRLRHGLVAVEVALSLILVASAGLLVRSFVAVQAQETGFRVADVWTVPLSPTGVETAEDLLSLMEGIAGEAAGIPGVAEAAWGLTMPLELTGGNRCCWGTRGVTVDSREVDARVSLHPVSVAYFDLLELELTAGRSWSAGEAAGTPVPVVLSEPLAAAAFGSAAAAVGRSFEASFPAVVVGVTADNRHYGLETPHGPAIYLPVEHLPFGIPKAHLAVRVEAAGVTGDLPRALREAVWSEAPELPVPTVRSLEGWLDRSTAERRFQSALFGTFATLALVLAAVGLYGTLLYMAGERRKEVGIRLALGATRGSVERRLLRSGLGLTLAGVLLGLGGAWYAGRLLETQIFGVERGDPVTLLGAAGVLLATAAMASWLPARRAGRTDPVETLRTE